MHFFSLAKCKLRTFGILKDSVWVTKDHTTLQRSAQLFSMSEEQRDLERLAGVS